MEPAANTWITTPAGRFLLTESYLQGAWDAQAHRGAVRDYPKGPEFAQYRYGISNEMAGHHDEMDLPFNTLGGIQ